MTWLIKIGYRLNNASFNPGPKHDKAAKAQLLSECVQLII